MCGYSMMLPMPLTHIRDDSMIVYSFSRYIVLSHTSEVLGIKDSMMYMMYNTCIMIIRLPHSHQFNISNQ